MSKFFAANTYLTFAEIEMHSVFLSAGMDFETYGKKLYYPDPCYFVTYADLHVDYISYTQGDRFYKIFFKYKLERDYSAIPLDAVSGFNIEFGCTV